MGSAIFLFHSVEAVVVSMIHLMSLSHRFWEIFGRYWDSFEKIRSWKVLDIFKGRSARDDNTFYNLSAVNPSRVWFESFKDLSLFLLIWSRKWFGNYDKMLRDDLEVLPRLNGVHWDSLEGFGMFSTMLEMSEHFYGFSRILWDSQARWCNWSSRLVTDTRSETQTEYILPSVIIITVTITSVLRFFGHEWAEEWESWGPRDSRGFFGILPDLLFFSGSISFSLPTGFGLFFFLL